MNRSLSQILYPLSSAQREIWFDQSLYPDTPLYNIGCFCRITGSFDTGMFHKTITQLVQECDILRLRLTEQEGMPLQYFADMPEVTLRLIDCSMQEHPEQAAQDSMRAAMQQPFDLLADPLFRFTVYKLAEDCHLWLQVYHHVMLDGWATSLITRRVVVLYNALQQGTPAPLVQEKSYLDFVESDTAYLNSASFERHRQYWQQKFATLPAPLLLPKIEHASHTGVVPGGVHTWLIPYAQYAQLEALATSQSASVFHVLLGILYTYFSRVQNQDECVIGLPVLNRNTPAFKQTVGLFASMIPARFDFGRELDFTDLIQAIAKSLRESYRNQRFPISEISRIARKGVTDRRPLFDLSLSFEKQEYGSHIGDCQLQTDALTHGFEQRPLAIFVREFMPGQDVQIDFAYNLAYFDAPEIERFQQRFIRLIEEVIQDPVRPLHALDILPPAERQQLLIDWNTTAQPLPARQHSIHQLFEDQVTRSPQAIAIVFEQQTLTYASLNARANQLAHRLIALGVGADIPVAIALQRSPEMIVALLAVFKAGGAYVPLDPDYPPDRLAFMLEDSAAAILITTTALRPLLPAAGCQQICLDAETTQLAQQPAHNPQLTVAAHHLAYIIYTSGSTGKPKGVAVEHRGLANLAAAQTSTFALSSASRVLQFASCSFDASISEIAMTWYAGTALYLPNAEQRLPGPPLLRYLDEAGITHATLPPTALAALPSAALPQLRCIIVAGEPCPPALAASWAEGRRFFNAYGPTETTVCATIIECLAAQIDTSSALPIGRAIANTRLYVLDEYGQPTPTGVAGELHIGGAGLARGYLNQPELTAQKFIHDPFSNLPGARLYKTGDLVRYLPDGNLLFLGRLDHQVKIRGFRIELGEIEAALAAHPAVRDIVVSARADARDDMQLVAWLVLIEGSKQPAISELRALLKTSLPEFMLPAAFVFLPSLPLTPNGKVDRKALPALDGIAAQQEHVAARDATEEILAGLWASVLNQAVPGIHDNFFEFGGHSLLAIQLSSRIRDALGITVPVRWLFEAPTIAELAVRLRNAGPTAAAAEEPMVPVSRGQPLPLSFAQQRLWFLDQLEGPSATYNMPGVLALTGTLDVSALAAALSEIVRRHEALRTCLLVQHGESEPVQVILPATALYLPVEDLRHHDDPDQVAQKLAQQEALIPFDLDKDLPLRTRLLQRHDTAWTLLLTLHHSAADGWSIPILMRELSALYVAFLHDLPSPLPELDLQYVDFTLWQRQWLSRERLERQRDYWRTALAGAPDCLTLPTDRARPLQQSYAGQALPFAIDATLTRSLQALSQRAGATLFMSLLTAWSALLARYSGEDDIVVGSPVANRAHSAVESMIGFFVNTLALRADLSGTPSFLTALARLRHTCLEAYAHQDLPFEALVETLGVPRDLAHAPLFQVMFVLQNNAQETLALPGLDIAFAHSDSTVAKFDLTLIVTETADGLSAAIEYASDLFDQATVLRMTQQFVQLLQALVAEPERPLYQLDILPAAERRLLLRDWNATAAPLPQLALHASFEAQVARSPQAIAVVFEEQTLTYASLNARANQLAHQLIALGIGPDIPVAIALQRSQEMIIALLAVLKAGGAYVPLDPDYPPERLAFMLTDARAAVLITTTALRKLLPHTTSEVLCLDAEAERLAKQPDHNPQVRVEPQHQAYIIYTSGSTGKPKGVMIEHRSIALHCDTIQAHFELTASDRVLQFASSSFDTSIEQILPTLYAGATIILPSVGLQSPETLDPCLQQHAVTVLNIPPAFFRLWSVSSTTRARSSLRLLVLGGDVLTSQALTVRAHWSMPGLRLLNAYGPTEATITTTTYEVPTTLSGPVVPIGRPLPHRSLYVLDPQGQPTPLGVPGELHIGGVGLARGYLHQPELTAQKFIHDPFSQTPGARLYKTGDLVRYLPDGNLLFLGRLDHQVKIRGFRIELGEIEAALAAHPAVRDVVVIARPDPRGDAQLVAYLVAHDGLNQPAISELRALLKTSLPEFMVPAAFVFLAALPLTPNGKVDRKALPAPDGIASQQNHVAARDPIEEILAGLWASVLNQAVLGIHDNFFERGGHSLLAIQLISRMRDALGITMPVRWLFEAPTIAELAQRLRNSGPTAATAENLMVRVPRDQPLPLSFAQQRLWFLDQLEGPSATYNMPGVLALTGTLDEPALAAALSEIVRRHEALRTCLLVQDGESEPVQVILPPSPLSLPIEDLRQYDDPDAVSQQLAQQEALIPFDLAKDLPLRARLLQRHDHAWSLLLTLHHSAADGWSVPILMRELSALYAAFLHDLPSPLPELNLQYADFTLWQRQWLSGDRLEQQRDYWRTALAGAPDCLTLPTDRARPLQQSYAGQTLPFVIDATLTRALQALSQRAGATLFMSLLTAWSALLARYSGEDDIVVGSPVANRNQSAIEPMIGFFVNTLALRADLSGTPSFLTALARLRHTCLEAYAHQDLPFEALVETLGVPRDLAHAPLFQVMFVLQNNAQETLALPGLDVAFGHSDSTVAKFDLTLSMTETADGMDAVIEYASDLFDQATMLRMTQQFVQLLQAIAVEPERPLCELDILPPAERRQLLIDWNATAEPLPQLAIHTSFEAQVARAPEAVAVVFENQTLSYADLNARANQLAHHLIALGIGPDIPIAIALQRSPDMIVALLAVLKAGGAYVPLDSDYPLDRLAFMLRDSGAQLLITRSDLNPALTKTAEQILNLDTDAGQIAARLHSNPDRVIAPTQLAYIIYTSGSTGKPKGVAVEHRGLANLAQAQMTAFAVTSASRILQFASSSFDASISEIAMTWCAGATLYLPNAEQRLPGPPLLHYLDEADITHVTLPPSALAALPLAALPQLRCIIVAGEPCPPALAASWAEGRRFFNAYGPTETTVCASIIECLAAQIDTSSALPIGRAIANTRLYVLDQYGQPTPTGVAGELHIGGVGLARGYLNQPELTAQKFIHDPFSQTPGARLYKTGDLARYLPDGNLLFLGRMDHQVKIRGFRIELGEIEAALAVHPAVREVVVSARPDPRGDAQLLAYLVAEEGTNQPAVSELRTLLKTSLPEFMVPAAFVFLPSLQLTPNGKVDRKALPAPDHAASHQEHVAPRDAIEEILAGLWATVLNQPVTGIHHNFFELGGHSLLAIQLSSRIRDALGIAVPVRWLFEAPTIAELADRLRETGSEGSPAIVITPANHILPDTRSITPDLLPLVSLSQHDIDQVVATVAGGTANVQDIYPLVALQEGILFHHQLQTTGDTYLSHALLAFDSPARSNAFIHALQTVIDRHDLLRTAVVWEQLAAPVQVVWRSATLPVEQVQFDPAHGAIADQLVAAFDPRHTRIDLTQAPLLRVVVTQDGERSLLLLQSHHLVFDHTTFGIMLEEIALLLQNQADQLAPPLPFRNFIAQANSVSAEAHASFFRAMLGTIDMPTAPFGLLDIQGDGATTREARHDLAPVLTQRLRRQARSLGLTPAAVFHLAWALVLARCCAQDEVVFGTVLLGRLQGDQDIERAMGMFINTLPFRVSCDHRPLTQALRETQQDLLALTRHEQASLSLAQRCSALPASTPLFSALLNYRHSVDGSHAALEGMTLLSAEERTNFPFCLSVDDFGKAFALTAQVDASLDPERICGFMQGALEIVVSALEETPQTPLCELDILPSAERRQLLIDWNASSEPAPQLAIHAAFEAQVARSPEAIAIVFEQQTLTYASLNARANQLAHVLIDHGVGADIPVAIALERSPEMIIALLAVLKAGGAYVPLDPDYPPERLAFMLTDARAAVLITTTALRKLLPHTTSEVLCLDAEAERLAKQPDHNPQVRVEPQHQAYIIYTSGSTGKPKGVMIEHRSIALHCDTIQAHFELTASDRVLQFASSSFDTSIEQILPTLYAGATIILPSVGLQSPETLDPCLQQHAVTVLNIPPAFFRLWSVSSTTRARSSLRLLVLGGDVLTSQALTVRAHWSMPGLRLLNAYGPTEATITTTTYEVPTTLSGPVVPIGRPLPHRSLYVLDPQGQPTPLGVPGELHIGGVGLARGYLHQPELTAQKFIHDPFSQTPGARLYKTGDLVRYLPDGNLLFLGRLDHQVKIRGFRIELGEIEAALALHPAVRDVVVIARPDPRGDAQLVAYLVAEEGTNQPAISELRALLKTSLPEFMVPAAFVFLAALPLTPNGKIDRKALPAPDNAASHQEHVDPRDAIEEILAGLWATVLQQAVPSIHHNFFELGGHSLLAIQLTSRIRDALGIAVPVRWLFEAPTIAELAQRLRNPRPMATTSTDEVMSPAPRDQALPLSFAQQRLWFLDQLEGPSATYNMPGVLALTGTLDVSALAAALSEIVRRHEALRTCLLVQDGESEPVQVILPATALHLPVDDLRLADDPDTAAQHLAHQEALIPFDLAHDLPLRARLLQRHDTAWTLLLTLHHSAADGWSIPILMRELSALYAAFLQGKPSPLAELELQYVDFTLWQRQWLSGERLEQQRDYWRTALAGAPDCLTLPTDRARPLQQSYAGQTLPFAIDATLTHSLQALSQRAGATLFMSLLTAWSALLARYSGEDDIVVGSPVANRAHSAVEPMIGFFVNTLALRADLSGQPSFLTALSRLRHTCLEAYAHQDLPFEALVETLGVPRDLAHAPLFQVMFVLQNNAQETLALPGLDIAFGHSDSTVAKFDLTLIVTETTDGLSAAIEYASDLFDQATVLRMTQHFVQLLQAIALEPERPLCELDILPPAERRQLLIDWNTTAQPLPVRQHSIHQLFEDQVARSPQAIAIVFEEQTLTYASLNARANQLAHQLIDHGVGPDIPVAIALERSPEMIIALLAVLKAGGAYVPLDPEYPAERLAFMLTDAGAAVLITTTALRKLLPHTTSEVLCLDAEAERLANQPDHNPQVRVEPQHLAYIIYTSGSTGKPKGVAIEHRSPTAFIGWVNSIWSKEDLAGVLAGTSICFDLSIFEIFGPLSAGGTIILANNVLDLPRLKHRNQVTLVNTVPSAIDAIISRNGLPGSVRVVNSAGEPLTSALADRIYAVATVQKVFDLYGPSEDTTYSTFKLRLSGEPASIGRPIANTQLYVLDHHGQPTPLGIPGELHIGGAGLARGYLHQPELTAQKFIHDPFSNLPGARLYKTGDLVRYLPDGNLLFLGRMDHQVKIRGFRIELGEIEAALALHPAVREVVVIARPDPRGDAQLVAYLVAHDGFKQAAASELRALLKTSLLEFMVPAAFVFLPTLPLTPNGKVDRKALPAPDDTASHQEHVAPRDAIEEILAGLWASVLNQPVPGIHDNFFERGGHSLLAVHLVAKITKHMGRHLSVRQVFATPTIAGMASLLRSEQETSSGSCLVRIRPQGSRAPLFFLPGAVGSINYLYALGQQLDPEIPLFTFEAQGLKEHTRPHTSIEAMATHYVTLLLEAQPNGPYFLAGHSLGGRIAFEMAQILMASGHEIKLLAIVDSPAPSTIKQSDDLEDDTVILQGLTTLFGMPSLHVELAGLSINDQLAYVTQRFQQTGLLPADAENKFIHRQFEVYKAHLQMASRYAPQSSQRLPITLYRANEEIDTQQVRNALSEDLGWGKYASQKVTIHYVSGNHVTMMDAQHVAQLAQLLGKNRE